MVPSHIYCTTCGAENQAQDTFCLACGRPLRATTPLTQYSVAATASSTQTGLLTPNHLLKQRYRILEQLGKGGFGAVYKAEDTQFGNRFVAVKEMSQSGLTTPQEIDEAAKAFEREVLMLAGLRHQYLPRIYDHFQDGGRWYLVMDFIDGETLVEHLHKARGGHLSVEEALQIATQLCTVLDYLHTRQPPIIFRDLTPANIMLTPDGHLYLIDFGIARHFKPGQTKDTTAFGSPGYAAPEQYGSAQTTPRSDIYSLGAILHQMVSGDDPSKKPFRFAPLQLSGHPILSRLPTLVMQMLDMDESKRPASMAAVKQELQHIAAQLAGQTSLPPTLPIRGTFHPSLYSLQGKKRMFALIAGIVAVMLIGGYVISAALTNQSRQSSSPIAIANSSPTESPTPTPLPKPGTVLCQPKADEWPQNGAWQTVGTEYVYREGGSSPPVVAPCDIPVSDYAVEAKIRTSETTTSLMWVVARFDSGSGAGYKGGIGVGVLCNDCIHAELYDMLNSQRNTAEFGAFSVNTVYTIKLQVKGTDVALYVNNSLVLEQHYTSANDAGKVGVECDQACEVLQFTVVAQ